MVDQAARNPVLQRDGSCREMGSRTGLSGLRSATMTSQPFPGTLHDRAPRISRGFAAYDPVDETLIEPVRHLAGYDAFVSLSASSGADPALLAADIDAIAAFARDHWTEITTYGAETATAIFLGNVLVHQRGAADWLQYGDDLPSAGTRRQRYGLLHLLLLLVESDDETFRECLRRIREWVNS